MRVTTHHLEMTDPVQLVPAAAPCRPFALVRAEVPSPQLNRFLYTAVGGDWFWLHRLSWSYARWLAYLSRPELETWVASVAGTPAGYFELEAQADAAVEIVYFGLLPQFIGEGLGGALLDAAVRRAWARGAGRVWLHTCTLDHPHALAHYQARGFRVFKVVESEEEIPPRSPGAWPGAR